MGSISRRNVLIGASLAAGNLALTACGGSPDPQRGKDAKEFSLTLSANAISGGKNAAQADWVKNWVIPNFVKAQKAKGVTAKVSYLSSGLADEQYKTKLALDLMSRSGPDVMTIDDIWVGSFAQAGYIKPLPQVVGSSADKWDGWKQITTAVQSMATYGNQRYGIPSGTDGRILYYNKVLFRQAGLPQQWQPTSWQDILDAARKLKRLPGVTPLQINAGTAMGEATTMQGVLPLLAGAGGQVNDGGKWYGATPQLKAVLTFYRDIYTTGLGDPDLQKEVNGRDESFQEFAKGKIGILAESDYLWRSVIDPKVGIDPMKARDNDVGYALIPADQPGKGLHGASFVSLSGGSVDVLNPHSSYPQQAFELLTFMHSPAAEKARMAGGSYISERNDVNKQVLKTDPLLTFISEKVLPITGYRPSNGAYLQVSTALQQATADIVAGKSVSAAADAYTKNLEEAVGARNVIH